MAPSNSRIGGPATIRLLLSSSETYQHVIQDVVLSIHAEIEAGMLVESEVAYARLLLSLAAVESGLFRVCERCRVLLGLEEDERCPTCNSPARALMPGLPCPDGWHFGKVPDGRRRTNGATEFPGDRVS